MKKNTGTSGGGPPNQRRQDQEERQQHGQQRQQQHKQHKQQLKKQKKKYRQQHQYHHAPSQSARTPGGAVIHFTKVDLTDSLKRPHASRNPYFTQSFSPLSSQAHDLEDAVVSSEHYQQLQGDPYQSQQQEEPQDQSYQYQQQETRNQEQRQHHSELNVHTPRSTHGQSNSKKKKPRKKKHRLVSVTDPYHGSQQSASGSNSASCSVSSNVGGDSIRNATDGLIDNVSDNPSNQQQQQQQPELRSQSSEEEATTLSQLQPGQRIRSGSQYLVLEADSSFVFTGDSGLEQLASQLDNNNFWSDHSAAEDYDSQVVQNSAHYDRAEPTVYGDSTSSVPKSPTHVVSRSMVSDSLLQELEMDTSPVVTMELSAKGIHVVNPEPENILETGPQDSEMDGSTGVVSPSEGIVQTTVEESNATSTVPLATESGAEPESKLTTVDAQPVLILSATLLPLSSSSGRKPQNHEVHIQSSQGSTPIEKDLSQTNISSNVTDSTARPSQSPSHPAVNYDPTTSKCEILECIEIPIRIRRPPSVRLRNASDEEAHGGHGRFVAGNSKKRRARDTGTAHELEWGCREETEDSELSPSPEASENASSRTKKFRTKDDSSYLEPASDASWDVDNVSVNDEEEDGEDDEVEEIEMILRGRRSSRLRANSHHTSPFTSLPQQNVMDSPSRNTRSSSAALQFSDVSVTHHGMDDSDDSDYRSPRQSSKNSNKKARRVSVASNPAKSPSVAKSAVSDEVTPDHGLRSNRFSSTPDSNSNNESQDHGQDSRDQSDVTRLRTIWHDKKIGWPLRHSKRGNAPVVVQPYSRDLVFGTALPLPCKN